MKWKVVLIDFESGEFTAVDGKFRKRQALEFARIWQCPENKTTALVTTANAWKSRATSSTCGGPAWRSSQPQP